MTLHQLTDSAKTNITQLFILFGDYGSNERSHLLPYPTLQKVTQTPTTDKTELKLTPDTFTQKTPIKKRSP